ncbi:MAG TPA: metallophosphoesterase, partial [Chthoniobacterales bacterium]|nr:metallophosphoesterase [Chthoniobacterales bacterium]
MGFIFTIIGLMVSLDVLCWIILARLSNPGAPRVILSLFMLAMMAGLLAIIVARMSRSGLDRLVPKFAVSTIFIWHFVGLGLLVLIGVALVPIFLTQKLTRDQSSAEAPPARASGWTRRDFLRTGAALLPPVFTFSLAGIAMAQLSGFRVRRFVLPIVDLPGELDGTTIAQVSDMHVGRFTNGDVLQKMVRAVNDMRADLVLLTGDLINDALADLDTALELVRRMEARFGIAIIEGNHDLIENPREFESRVRASRIPFLLNESMLVDVRGVPIQLLGTRWPRAYGKERDNAIGEDVRHVLEQRDSSAFPILLAHHPHAFDAACEEH